MPQIFWKKLTNPKHKRANSTKIDHKPENMMQFTTTVQKMRRRTAEVQSQRDKLQNHTRIVQWSEILKTSIFQKFGKIQTFQSLVVQNCHK